MTDYDDIDLGGPEPARFGPQELAEIARKVKLAIENQKSGPLPAWIKAPRPKNPGVTPGRR